MFYIENENKIVLFDEDKQKLQNTIHFMPQYEGLKIKETQEGYVIYDFELITVEEKEAKETQKEQERINKLTMTALDFIGFLQDAGLTLEQINAYLEANLAVKIQLTYCQNVYCGVAKSLMPITFEDITITADMVEIAFRIKNGETIDEDNSAGEASDETSNEDETSSNPPVDNNEEIEE